MYAVPNRSAATLMQIIQHSILPGTTVMSDLWRAYGGINTMGFKHFTVNHSVTLWIRSPERTHKLSKTPGS